jgi:hypothetical protein
MDMLQNKPIYTLVNVHVSKNLGRDCVDVRIILKFNFKKWDGGEHDRRLDRVRWDTVKRVVNLRVPKKCTEFLDYL